jgi:hypothetical protein
VTLFGGFPGDMGYDDSQTFSPCELNVIKCK